MRVSWLVKKLRQCAYSPTLDAACEVAEQHSFKLEHVSSVPLLDGEDHCDKLLLERASAVYKSNRSTQQLSIETQGRVHYINGKYHDECVQTRSEQWWENRRKSSESIF